MAGLKAVIEPQQGSEQGNDKDQPGDRIHYRSGQANHELRERPHGDNEAQDKDPEQNWVLTKAGPVQWHKNQE
jgi:hypothetical protein